MRIFISVYFVIQMGAPPADEWEGRGGMISSICNHIKGLNDGDYRTVKKVLEDTVHCHKNGLEYMGEGRYGNVGGHNKLILQGSYGHGVQ